MASQAHTCADAEGDLSSPRGSTCGLGAHSAHCTLIPGLDRLHSSRTLRPDSPLQPPGMILILTAGRPRPGEDQEGEPAGGGCSLAGPRGSGRRLGTDARQHRPRAALAPRGLRSPQGPRVPARRTAAVPAPPQPLGA